MIITSGDVEPRLVLDYDFVFLNGVAWPVTIDVQAGDSIDFQEGRTIIKLSPRPSPTDVGVMLPAEETIVYMNNVIILNKRQRTFIPPSPEQRNEIRDLMKQASKSVH